jgi:pyrroline-5-carboxylate reductase
MGPTYFWYQLYELLELGRDFGLSDQELKSGLTAMMAGAHLSVIQAEKGRKLGSEQPSGDNRRIAVKSGRPADKRRKN